MNVRQIAHRAGPPATAARPGPTPGGPTPGGPSFADRLAEAGAPPLTVSAHARARLEQRGISLDPEQQEALAQAVRFLDGRGSKDALVVRSDAAFVVNIPSRTVVTAVAQDELVDRVFTQIDSAMLI